MARLVLLRFKDNAEAEFVVRHLVENAEQGISTALPSTATVEWVVAQPVSHCQCNIVASPKRRSRRARAGNEGFSKSLHYGWWVHPLCRRVSKMVKERFTAHMTNGAYDLLPEILGDPNRVPNDQRQFMDTSFAAHFNKR